MSLDLEPAELSFKRPYTEEVSQILRLRNNNAESIAFKVKTTAPKQYCVRPNSGTIRPGEVVNVSVVLQPMKQDPPPDARCKDKFLVQSVAIPTTKEAPQWSDLEKNYKSAIQERKIRVIYLPADGSAAQSNGVDDTIDESTLSPPPVYTPHAQTSSKFAEPSSPQSSARSPDTDTAVNTPAASAPETIVEYTREELKKLYADAQATIVKLKNDATEAAGLRKRNGGGEKGQLSSGTVGVLPVTSQPTGVPVPTVALLCLIVFLLTWLLF